MSDFLHKIDAFEPQTDISSQWLEVVHFQMLQDVDTLTFYLIGYI